MQTFENGYKVQVFEKDISM